MSALVDWLRTSDRLRVASVAVVASLVATLISTVGRPDEVVVAQVGRRFPLAVQAELSHLAGQDVVVTVGSERSEARAAGGGRAVDVEGTAGVSGLVEVTDAGGHLAGVAVAPKDDDVLPGLDEGAALDVSVDYETTAFGLFAMQPGLASTEPSVTVLLAALVVDLPELGDLARALEEAAQRDPAYLEDLSPEVQQALGRLLTAFDEHVADLDAQISAQIGSGSGSGSGTGTGTGDPVPTSGPNGTGADDTEPVPTSRLRAPTSAATSASTPLVADPDGCGDEPVENVTVLDADDEDHVCITEATFDGAWEVHGTSSTPRWAVARAVNRNVPAASWQLIPGRALAFPSLEKLAYDLVESEELGRLDEEWNAGVKICNALLGLAGWRCAEPNRPGIVRRVLDKAKEYFGDADFAFRLDGSESRTYLTVNGLGRQKGDVSGEDMATSILTSVLMAVVVPAIGMVADAKRFFGDTGTVSDETRRALADTAAGLYGDLLSFSEEIQTGGVLDKFGAVAELVTKIVRATVDSGLLLILLREFFVGVATAASGETAAAAAEIAEELASLEAHLASGPIGWIVGGIDAGIALIDSGVTLLMLLDDLPELATSVRYRLGGEPPGPARPARTDPLPGDEEGSVPNPPLPTDSCGLRVALVLDRSGSIRFAGDAAMAQVREAAVDLVDPLATTPSSVRISAFGTWSTTRIGWTSLAGAEGRRAAHQAAATVEFARTNGADGGTNWEAALTDVLHQQADLVVLVTDGTPTVFGAGIEGSDPAGGHPDFDPAAFAAGLDVANQLKRKGTRVVAVGVGDVDLDQLRKVSGPEEGSDYFLGADFASLGQSLSDVATELCGGGLVVRHRVGGIATGGAEYTVDSDGQGPQTLVTEADGVGRLSLREGSDGVTVGLPPGLPLTGVTCDQGGRSVAVDVDEGERTMTIDLHGVVTCTFDWWALSGPDVDLAEILHGSGQIDVVSFAPDPDAGDVVVGCLGRAGTLRPAATAASSGSTRTSCDVGQFGVDWAAGFAVFRYDDTCSSCAPADELDVGLGRDGVHVRLDESPGRSPRSRLGFPAAELDLTIAASEPGHPTVTGTLVDDLDLEVSLRRPPEPPLCLARRYGSDRGVLATTASISTGTGC